MMNCVWQSAPGPSGANGREETSSSNVSKDITHSNTWSAGWCPSTTVHSMLSESSSSSSWVLGSNFSLYLFTRFSGLIIKGFTTVSYLWWSIGWTWRIHWASRWHLVLTGVLPDHRRRFILVHTHKGTWQLCSFYKPKLGAFLIILALSICVTLVACTHLNLQLSPWSKHKKITYNNQLKKIKPPSHH